MLSGTLLKSRLSAAILLISSATLLAVEPWVDHTASWPVGQPGGIRSKGDFHIPPDFTFVGVRLLVLGTAPTRDFREFVLPPNQIQLNGTTGTWDTTVPTSSGNFEVLAVVKIQSNITGQFEEICTELHTGPVTVP